MKFLLDYKRKKRAREFAGSQTYWESRYAAGGTSGSGSYGRLAHYKAEVLNTFIETHGVRSVVEFGSGDGNQLSLMKYPNYTGLDVSRTAVEACKARFKDDASKEFYVLGESEIQPRGDLALSLDVIYHLVEDEIFNAYMRSLFAAGERFTIVYSSNHELPPDGHLRHRRFTNWVDVNAPGWNLIERIENRYPFDPASPDETSLADFYVFKKEVS